METTAIILTAYNRPTLVVEALQSILEQGGRWRLYLMDDGSDDETRAAIAHVLAPYRSSLAVLEEGALLDGRSPLGALFEWPQLVWWQGVAREMAVRKATIPYSVTINLCLNFLAQHEEFMTFLCDDDVLMPGAVYARAKWLSENPRVDVCFGRLRAVEYGADGRYNQWTDSGRPRPGRAWLEPTGHRVVDPEHGNARQYYAPGQVDPLTGLDYVEEGFWQPGPSMYGHPHRIDHNQPLIRTRVLADRSLFPFNGRYFEYWPEDRTRYGVGDAGFFMRLARRGPFHGVDCWAVTKRYHVRSDGVSVDERRE